MRNLIIGAIAALTIAGPAEAVSFSSVGAISTPGGPKDPLAVTDTVLVDFDNAPHSGVTVATSGTAALYTGSYSGLAAAPAGDTTKYLALGTGGKATVNVASYLAANSQVKSLSVYLGSIDSYNTLEVLNTAGNVIKTWTGNDLPPHNGDWLASATNRRLSINFDHSDNVGALRFSSSGVAFEFDTIAAGAAAVPEPANWAMMIGGFGMIGAAMRRRQSVTTRLVPQIAR